MMKLPKYKTRIVAFIDILGFENLILSLENNDHLHSRIYDALLQIKSIYSSSVKNNTAKSDLEVSTFSDSIVISSNSNSIFSIVWTCGWLQAQLLGIGILTRGGISSGLTVHENGMLYGNGLLKAYKIESSAAVYPRIVIDHEIMQLLNSKVREAVLEKDVDGLWFVDPFKFYAWVGNADELLADGYDPRECYFQELERYINEAIKCGNELSKLAKWTWLEKRAEIASKRYNDDKKRYTDLNTGLFFKKIEK